MTDNEEEWNIACSDEESYEFTLDGEHLPPKKDIIDLYTKLSKGESVTLDWKCIARRPPTPEVHESSRKMEVELETAVEENKNEVTKEFDFDEPEFDANPITPKRTPGSAKAPKSQKRVARLDKIMNDMFRHKSLNAPGTQSAGVHKQSPRGSPRGSPRASPKPSSGFPSPRGSSPKSATGLSMSRGNSPKPAVKGNSPRAGSPRTTSESPQNVQLPNIDTSQKESPKS